MSEVAMAIILVVAYLFGVGLTAGLAKRRGWNEHLDSDPYSPLTTKGGDAIHGILWPVVIPVWLCWITLEPMVAAAHRIASHDHE